MANGFSRNRWEENIFDKVGQPTCSAVVYQAKGKTIAKVWDENHDRFKIIAQKKAGVDDAGVIQSALDSLTPGRTWKEKVVLVGDFYINNSVVPIQISDYTDVCVFGKLTAEDYKKTMIHIKGEQIRVKGGIYDGNNHGNVAKAPVRVIHVDSCVNTILESIEVLNGYSRGIEVDYPNNVILKDIISHDCWRNIMLWINTKDLSTFDGKIIVKNISSYNSFGGNSIDGTMKFMDIDGGWLEGTCVFDGFSKISIRNLKGNNASVILTAGNWDGVLGAEAIISNIEFSGDSKVSLSAYDVDLDKVLIKDCVINKEGSSLGSCIVIVILGSSIVSNVLISNCITSNGVWAGIQTYNTTGATGKITNLSLTNSKAIDCKQYGVRLTSPTDYLQISNVEASGNDWRGFLIQNVGTLIMNNILARKSGKYNQDGPLNLVNITRAFINNAWLEYGGVGVTITDVSELHVKNVKGDTTSTTMTNEGTATFSGDGTTTTFTIPHGLVSTPSNVQVTPKSQDAAGNFYVTADATNIYVNYLTAPPLGTDNIVLDWSAEV